MSASDRIKRPPVERSAPLRNWSTLFKASVADSDSAEAESAPAGASDGASLNDVVSRSVDLGYRVIDEYVRQGQKAAQRLNERTYGTETMAGDVQDLAMRTTQYASDFAAVWLQLVQLAAVGSAASSPAAAGNGSERAAPEAAAHPAGAAGGVASVGAAAAPAERTRVRVEVRSAQPTDVTVDVHPDATRLPLIVHALRSAEEDKPRISEVHFEPGSDEAAACLRIRVPAGQPPGVYNGLLIDERTSRPVGTVSVTVAE